MNSRAKGKRGELELAHKLKEYGIDARRGQQYCGSNGDADVVGLEGYHIECKRVEKLDLVGAMAQSIADAKEGETAIVMHRKDRSPWFVTMELKDFMRFYYEHR
jgi:Holliday junction resolvase